MKFDARVIGIPNHLSAVKKALPKPDYQAESAKLQAAKERLLDKFPDRRKTILDIFARKSACLGHVLVERYNFLAPLQDFACFVDGTTPTEVRDENAWTESLHLVLPAQGDALVVPLDFNVPCEATIEGRSRPYVVCSTQAILREMNRLNEFVAVEQTLGLSRMGPFVSLNRADMERFEKREGVGRKFWARFALVALRDIVEQALESGLPMLLDPNAEAVPIEA